MSSTTGPFALGTAMTSGLLPMHGTVPPHGGRLGMVLVQQIPITPAWAACQPYVPPRIQWLVLPSATHPIPCSRLSATARFIAACAFRLPGPRLPSHRSRAPKLATARGSAFTSITPSRIMATNREKRLMPCVYTPSQVVSANRRAHMSARSAAKPSLCSTAARVLRTSSNGIRFMNLFQHQLLGVAKELQVTELGRRNDSRISHLFR